MSNENMSPHRVASDGKLVVAVTNSDGTAIGSSGGGGGPVTSPLGTGVAATAVRTTLATDVGLPAGTALLGKVGVDQTTSGTTNLVASIAGQNGVAGGAGAVGATVQRMTLASDDPAVVSLAALATAGGYSAAVTLTRTADTNSYTANDVLGAATGSTAALTFASMGASGKEVMITSVSLEIDQTSIISGQTSYVLHLYNVTPPSALGDNVAFDLPSGDRASYLGAIQLGSPADLGSTLFVEAQGVNKQVKLSGTSLFGYLVTNGAYQPQSATVHVITLHSMDV